MDKMIPLTKAIGVGNTLVAGLDVQSQRTTFPLFIDMVFGDTNYEAVCRWWRVMDGGWDTQVFQFWASILAHVSATL